VHSNTGRMQIQEKRRAICWSIKLSHIGESISALVFSFRVVKKCKSSLDRQVREAIRIQMRGNMLNKR
jgi:hypothetical protein